MYATTHDIGEFTLRSPWASAPSFGYTFVSMVTSDNADIGIAPVPTTFVNLDVNQLKKRRWTHSLEGTHMLTGDDEAFTA